ncbi:MAG: hypothetical protein P4L99_23580 [Chthoniobacter sp.]|nr:hypothetical protein [Chthoniobacter sp.]
MRTMLSMFWFATLLFLAAVPLMSAVEPTPIPERFNAYIGGFLGSSYQLELHDGVLTYTKFEGGHNNPKRTTVTPTAESWRDFRKTLDDLKVWRWRVTYPSNGTSDGTQWSLDVAYADHTIKTHGDNSYPDSVGKPNGQPEPTEAFKRYLDAVKKLTGGKTFE